jgi:hypothetical protein
MTSTLVQERGLEAVPVLERGAATDDAGDALACIGTPEAVQALARVASSSKGALARLALSVDRWPAAAIAALSRLVAAGGKDANLVTPSLTRLLRAHGAPARAAALAGRGRAGRHRPAARAAVGPTEVADVGELPPCWLRRRGWRRCRRRPLPRWRWNRSRWPAEQWGEGEREKALRMNSWQVNRHASARKNLAVLLDELGFDKAKQKTHGPLGKAAEAVIRMATPRR